MLRGPWRIRLIRSLRRISIATLVALALVTLVAPVDASDVGATATTDAAATTRAATSPVVFRLPFAAGERHRIGQGWNTVYSHHGRSAFAYDIIMPIGTPVLASADGRVTHVHSGETACGGPALLEHANSVTVEHADGTATFYAHLSRVQVAVGDVVAAGQQLGLSGRTGYTSCVAHLHFARQAPGGPFTKSRPIYFEEYPGVQFKAGMFVEASPSVCLQTLQGMPAGAFCGTYFYGTRSRMATMARIDAVIDFDWSAGRPEGLHAPASTSGKAGFAAHWVGSFDFEDAGSFDFAITASGSVRLSIDGDVVLDGWTSPAPTSEIVVSRAMTAGAHTIDLVVHQPAGKTVIRLGWARSTAESRGIG